ncbi:hypothetical protein [Aeromonas caviae]|uniref:hypothetical protein n=1 Tax=Aeromonas caviae TaxID=648 RepID=UPI001112FFA6|nr:hypothetical protein [Aeromonas caviae]
MNNPKDLSFSASQGGINNTQNITNNNTVNYTVVNYLGGEANLQLLQNISSASGSKDYAVLVCAPPEKNASKTTIELFGLISNKIKENDIKLFIGGGMSIISDGRGYPHLNEHDFVIDNKCNAVVIFAEDYSTFIQLSHLSIIKDERQTSSIELFCFYDGGGVSESEFMMTGPIAFFTEAAKGYLYDTANIGDSVESIVDKVIKSILRHKALRSKR